MRPGPWFLDPHSAPKPSSRELPSWPHAGALPVVFAMRSPHAERTAGKLRGLHGFFFFAGALGLIGAMMETNPPRLHAPSGARGGCAPGPMRETRSVLAG